MELKEEIKKEIDLIPDEYLSQIQRYLKIIKKRKLKEKQIKTLHLKGKFDNVHIRRATYE